MSLLPLFVFDGEERPSEKRGKRISGRDHWMVQGMQNIIQAFGFEWHIAPGEAEAELAYLNRIGVIDGILSDDVDNFLFGAELVIRNPSATLSGNRAHTLKNSAGKIDDQHVAIYFAQDLRDREDIQLTRGGLILIGILRGGDYHQAGLTGCGVTIAHGLAKAGFGDSLYEAALTMNRVRLEHFLVDWRDKVREELRTNSRGLIGRKNPALAKAMPEDFPDVDIVMSYVCPITSETKGRLDVSRFDWKKECDIGKIAAICELYFEWGVKDTIIKRFRTVLWSSAVLRILRRSALLSDQRENSERSASSTPKKKKALPFSGTPSAMITKHFSSLGLSSPVKDHADSDEEDGETLIVTIHSTRNHAATDGILEYRLEIAPAQLVRLAESGIRGIRPELLKNPGQDDEDMEGEDDEGKTPADPLTHLRVWMPACMVEIAEPRLVEKFKAKELAKQDKKRGTARKTKGTKDSAASVSKSQRPVAPYDYEHDPAPRSRAKKTTDWSSDESSCSDRDVLPTLQPEPQTRKRTTAKPPSDTGILPDLPKARKATATKTPKAAFITAGGSFTRDKLPEPEDIRAPVERPVIDTFFKAKRVTTSTVQKTSSKASQVACLFEGVAYADAPKSSSQTQSHVVPSSQASSSSSSSRAQSILSFLNDTPMTTLSQKPIVISKARQEARTLRPFPMALDGHEPQHSRNPAPQTPQMSTQTRRRSKDNSFSDEHMEKIHKSPRKSHSRDSPRSNNTSPSSDTKRDRAVSPSPMRGHPIVKTLPRLSSQPLSRGPSFDQSIISISSDSDEDVPVNPTPPKLLPLTAAQFRQPKQALPRKPRAIMAEVIDLT
ncbi:hypothetical protein EUX98_g2810 [Antrodiella citrinella]|uniref:XPG-I domain-containing protein n=1 Tax=Antrodiella citrinella TaxID=2447956 RepID=A0A4S4N096_9APHY|nr:hypothetical protein EUX98_g2810 [Antrodiella citrinella]